MTFSILAEYVKHEKKKFKYLIKSKYLFIQELVFAILVADNQLVTMVRPKKFSLHPSGISVNFA